MGQERGKSLGYWVSTGRWMQGRKRRQDRRREETNLYIVSHLCPLKGPRSYDTLVARSMPSLQPWAAAQKEHESVICYYIKGKEVSKNDGDVKSTQEVG